MCIVNRFCYCCSLRLGAIVAAVVTVLIGVYIFTSGVIVLVNDEDVPETFIVACYIYITIAVALIIVSLCLLFATLKGSKCMAIPWLLIVLIFIAFGGAFIVLAIMNKIWIQLLGLIPLCIEIYLWLVVFAYFRSL